MGQEQGKEGGKNGMKVRNTKATVKEAYEEEAGSLPPEQLKFRGELEKAVAEYNRDGSEMNFKRLCIVFIFAACKEVSGFSPFAENGRAAPYEGKDGSWMVICTSPEEAALCPENKILLFNMDDVVKVTIRDRRYKGLCLNPYGGHPVLLERNSLWMLREAVARGPADLAGAAELCCSNRPV